MYLYFLPSGGIAGGDGGDPRKIVHNLWVVAQKPDADALISTADGLIKKEAGAFENLLTYGVKRARLLVATASDDAEWAPVDVPKELSNRRQKNPLDSTVVEDLELVGEGAGVFHSQYFRAVAEFARPECDAIDELGDWINVTGVRL